MYIPFHLPFPQNFTFEIQRSDTYHLSLILILKTSTFLEIYSFIHLLNKRELL